MAKAKTVYRCTECGAEYSKWQGRCDSCGEWHTLAYQEVNELTKRGLPGVWTHGFYDGWAPNYMLGIAQFRNSMGKFYETYTSGGAD